MKKYRIPLPGRKCSYLIGESEDVEYVNPIDNYKDLFFNFKTFIYKEIILKIHTFNSEIFIDNYVRKRIETEWEKRFNELINTAFPNELMTVLKADTKEQQGSALKNISLTGDEFIAFTFKAWENFGYSFSQYSAFHHHKGVDLNNLPKFIELDNDGTVLTVGKTTLSEGEQKQVVKHRKVIISKILDLKDSWHCFFWTYKSLGGEERYKCGQSHIHYISDRWGIPRDNVLEQLRSPKYSLPSLPHIDFYTYRNPK